MKKTINYNKKLRNPKQMFSKAHFDYLKKFRTRKLLISFTQILILVIFLLSWELLTKYEVVSSFFFSSPSKIIKTIGELYSSG